MPVIKIAPQLQSVLEGLGGETLSQKIARLLSNELRRYLEECEREILELEIKYGLDYQRFKERLESGELGDEFSYPLEKNAMRWEDLTVEKKHWLERVRVIKGLVVPQGDCNCGM